MINKLINLSDINVTNILRNWNNQSNAEITYFIYVIHVVGFSCNPAFHEVPRLHE